MSFPFLDHLVLALFALFAVTLLAGALIAVRGVRIIHSVCGLAISSVGLAGLYYLLNSPFLALMQILVYIGAVSIVIIFAIMLSEPDEVGEADLAAAASSSAPVPDSLRRQHDKPSPLAQALALLIGALTFTGLSIAGTAHPWGPFTGRIGADSVEAMGIALLTTYSLPFELISVVLLLAIVGALSIARLGRSHL